METVLARCDATPSTAEGGERRAVISFCGPIRVRRRERGEWASMTVARWSWPLVAGEYRRLRRAGRGATQARSTVTGLLAIAPSVEYRPAADAPGGVR
jgi:hypothetical protein